MNEYQTRLKKLMDEYVHLIYKITKKYPKDELFGTTSQIRRSSLSIILNYIEGYARKRITVRKNFLEVSYGSLQESKYLLNFSYKEKYLTNTEYELPRPKGRGILGLTPRPVRIPSARNGSLRAGLYPWPKGRGVRPVNIK